MVIHNLAKLYGLILEKKVSLWLESQGKRAKGKASFRIHQPTIDHLVTLRIIAHLFACFVDLKKAFDTVPQDKILEIIKEIIVTPELRIVVIRLYEIVTAKFNANEGWSKDIKCNIRVKQGCPISPTLFCIFTSIS